MSKINEKMPSYRLKGCGSFPEYKLNGSSLHDKSVIYLVSVGKDKFEGKWVTRFVNFIKEVQPKKLFIVLGDTLQRFNIELYENLDEKQAFKVAATRGIDWKKKYESYFHDLKFDYEFIFWEELKEDKDYYKYFTEIMDWNESDSFKQLLLESSKEYIARYDRNSYENRIIEQSNKFLNEECAIFRVLAKDATTVSIFYPGAPLGIFGYLFDHVNKHDRKDNPFFFKELTPTKENKKHKKHNQANLKLLGNLPFFMCDDVSIDDEGSNGCLPGNSISAKLL